MKIYNAGKKIGIGFMVFDLVLIQTKRLVTKIKQSLGYILEGSQVSPKIRSLATTLKVGRSARFTIPNYCKFILIFN